MKNKKRVVVVSGINGCGKSTFIKNLSVVLSERGVSFELFKAPNYDTVSGHVIKHFLAGGAVDNIENVFARNRAEVYESIWRSDADVVLVDRLDIDAFVYAELRCNTVEFSGCRPPIFL
jgi:thymidylate kinase